MKWRVKNKTLESALKGLFVNEEAYQMALDTACERARIRCDTTVHVSATGSERKASANGLPFYVSVAWDELESLEYNPCRWNSFPYCVPPKDVWMRVETPDEAGVKAKFCNGKWLSVDLKIINQVARFRPWEDSKAPLTQWYPYPAVKPPCDGPYLTAITWIDDDQEQEEVVIKTFRSGQFEGEDQGYFESEVRLWAYVPEPPEKE